MPSPDVTTVRALVAAQASSFADRPVRQGPTGWDNTHWLLGEDLAVRMPRRRLAVDLVRNEASVLPRVAGALPLAVPAPVVVGEPEPGVWEWPWTVVPWFAGTRADLADPRPDPADHAVALAEFLAALHVEAPDDAPHNPYRSVALAERAERFEHATAAIVRHDRAADAVPVLRDAWELGLVAGRRTEPVTWIHGDLHPGNQLVRDGRLVAVVDWGDVAAGDPASDLATAWWTLPVDVHPVFRAAYGGVAEGTWGRAAGWAAVIAAFLLDQAPRAGDEALLATARRTVARLRELVT